MATDFPLYVFFSFTQAFSASCTDLLVNNICRFKKIRMERSDILMDKNDELKFYIFKIIFVSTFVVRTCCLCFYN